MILTRLTLILILLLSISSVCLAQTGDGDGAIFKVERLNALVLLVVFSLSVLYYISRAKGGSDLFIRKLPGLEAIDEAVGRATEMGRSVLYIPGIQDLDDIQTIAGLSIPDDREIDGIDQSAFLYGEQEESNREGFLYWNADMA